MKTYEQALIAIAILRTQAQNESYLAGDCPDCGSNELSETAEDTLVEFMDQDGQEINNSLQGKGSLACGTASTYTDGSI